MSDETNKGRDARNEINVSAKDEVAYWSKLLGVSEEELRATVERVGPQIEDVARDLVDKAA